MGQLKALLPWNGTPLIQYQADQLLQSPLERVVIVLGHRSDEIASLLPADSRLERVVNPHFASGKVSSLLAGFARLPADASILVLGADQPRSHEIVSQAIRAHVETGATITIAGHQGRRGHPVIFAPHLRTELLAIAEESQGLRAVLQRHTQNTQVIEAGSPLALVNLNTPEDYAAAIRLNSTSSALAGNQ